ncbi:MAG: hypothetical protein CO095_15360 [Armatimonadetes bacterium CG_4_9_14_3_um_filter_58_7]|nr:MAG: hypothetical protein CO095_15360 [Armatimonadetes bacterium CG_4_9_14_3_um_filter_58_7]
MRIAHISDLHLRHHLPGTAIVPERQSRLVPALFAQAVDRIAAEKPDAFVLTGNILDYPLHLLLDPETQALAEKDLLLVAEILRGLPCPVFVVHGNHDHPQLVRKTFGDRHDEASLGEFRFLCFNDDEADDHFPERQFRERDRFHTALSDRDPAPQIHIQHYLTWPERNEGYPHTYRDASTMMEALAASGRVRLVLSGHYHRGSPVSAVEGVHYATAPAFCEPPHAHCIHDISEHGVQSVGRQMDDPDAPRRPAVFLDRDGTISVDPSYRWGPERLRLLPDVCHPLRSLRDEGYLLVVVTNQSCVAVGCVSAQTVGAVNDRMALLLREGDAQNDGGAEVDAVYCAYHSSAATIPAYFAENHPDVKPNPGMLLRAAEDLHLDLSRSFIVGDNLSDLAAGRRVGTKAILVRTGSGETVAGQLAPGRADYVAADLADAAQWILGGT